MNGNASGRRDAGASTCDGEILERIAARQETALREAIDVHGGAVYALACWFVRDRDIAEEVAQDAFLTLWNRPERVRLGEGSVRSFLLGVARHKAIDRVRSGAAQRRTTDAVLGMLQTAPRVSPGCDEAVLDRQRLAGALERLSAVQKEAVVLAYFGGRTYRQVARETDVPEGTAKTRLRDALRALRRDLSEDGTAVTRG